jgi:hypothetical protein
MFTPELLMNLLGTIQCLKKELAGSDAEKVEAAQEAYQELLEKFYKEYEGIMAIEQRRAARNDPDYFLVLIQLAYHNQEYEKVDKQEGQPLHSPDWKLLTRI